MMTLAELQKRVGRIAVEKGWNLPGLTDRDFCNKIMEEVGEAIQEIGNPKGELYYNFGSNKPEGIRSEISDVLIMCLSFASYKGWDLSADVEEKVQYNQERFD